MRGRGRDLGQRPKSGGRYTNPRVETHIWGQRPRSQGRDPRLGAETQVLG